MAHEDDIVEESLREWNALRSGRTVFNQHWEEVAELVLPSYRNTFNEGSFNTPGEKKTERQVDSTSSVALTRFSAIMDSLLTPRNMFWHGLEADNPDLQKLREVKMYFEATTRVIFKQRYKSAANFSSQNLNTYTMLGAFGNGALHIDALRSPIGTTGLRYKSMPLGTLYFRENFQGQIDGFCRGPINLNKLQAAQQFGEENLPQMIVECEDKARTFQFMQRVCPRTDYDPGRMDGKSKPFASYYIAVDGRKLVSESGYNTLPIAPTRYDQAPDEIYGRGPAMTVLAGIKTLNSEKRDFLTQGHRSAVPILLTTDDGVTDFSLRPGVLNKGGWSPDGKPLVGTLPVGNIQVTKEMMDDERYIINDAFLVNLFQVLQDNPQMTATQVIEIVNQKGILLAPTVGRQQSEYLGPMIERELDVLASLGLLPEMPEILREAKGEYNVVYTSPLAKQMRAQEVAGFGRTMEMLMGIVNLTQDPEPLDNFDFDVIAPQIAEIQSVPESWMMDPKKKEAKRAQRAQMMQQQQQVQAAPAAAALMSAEAKQQQAGVQK